MSRVKGPKYAYHSGGQKSGSAGICSAEMGQRSHFFYPGAVGCMVLTDTVPKPGQTVQSERRRWFRAGVRARVEVRAPRHARPSHKPFVLQACQRWALGGANLVSARAPCPRNAAR
jgi:hypothetical protein